jgi:hypothetical protein
VCLPAGFFGFLQGGKDHGGRRKLIEERIFFKPNIREEKK